MHWMKGRDEIGVGAFRCAEGGARPQCRQPNVNLRLVARRMISQRQRKI